MYNPFNNDPSNVGPPLNQNIPLKYAQETSNTPSMDADNMSNVSQNRTLPMVMPGQNMYYPPYYQGQQQLYDGSQQLGEKSVDVRGYYPGIIIDNSTNLPPEPKQLIGNEVPIELISNPNIKRSSSLSNERSNSKRREGGAGAGSGIPRTQARKRAATACDTCRFKKIKCDNMRPRCGTCIKTGSVECHYGADDHIKMIAFEQNTKQILSKLDSILDVLSKPNSSSNLGDLITPKSCSKDLDKEEEEKVSITTLEDFTNLKDCLWDFSITSVLKWRYLLKSSNTDLEYSNQIIKKLVKTYTANTLPRTSVKTGKEKIEISYIMENFLSSNFANLVNSFLNNCHSKIPILDTLRLIELIEIYKILKEEKKDLTFLYLLEEFDYDSKQPSELYFKALKTQNIEDASFRREAYRSLCKSVPVLLIIFALGAISTSLQMENLAKYKDSMEERSDISIGCLNENIPNELPKDRAKISQLIVDYAIYLTSVFPFTLRDNTITIVQYYLLLSQYYLYMMNPLKSHKLITLASNHMMFYLELSKVGENSYEVKSTSKKSVMDILFWTCLKLECELKTELSPFVPMSGITQVLPAVPFPMVPDYVSLMGSPSSHSEASINLANLHYDKYSWHFFLTEIAFRKVDNIMINELFSLESTKRKMWDESGFSDKYIWKTYVKYLNQYNGILYSLNPDIRDFVLKGSDLEEIDSILKKRYQDQGHDMMKHIPDHLREFFSDEISLKNKSESIIFIQTRVLASKLLLFRPLIYLITEDKVTFMEILAASFTPSKNGQSDTNSSASPSAPTDLVNMVKVEDDVIGISPSAQSIIENEDFSDLMTVVINENQKSSDSFELSDIPQARRRILRIFLKNLIFLPKSHVPNLSVFRHPGSWFYLRNLIVSNIYLFILYQKIKEATIAAQADVYFQEFLLQNKISSLDVIMDSILSRNSVLASLEHSSIVFNYWASESKDCKVYAEYVTMLMENL